MMNAPLPVNAWLRWARALGLVLATLALLSFAAGIAVRVQALQQPCDPLTATCTAYQPTPAHAAALVAAGVSLRTYAVLQAAKWIFFTSVWFGVGALIVARRPDDVAALAAGWWLMTFPTQWDELIIGLAAAYPALTLPLNALVALVALGFPLFLGLFPNGRFVPRWSLWLTLAWIAAQWLLPLTPPSWQLAGLGFTVGVLALAGLVVAQIIRYWRYSTQAERDRIRWVILGLALAAACLVVIVVQSPTQSAQNPLGTPALDQFRSELIYQLIVVIFPLSVGVAILRSRLWDIDVIIRRTLVYAVLSGLLALVYFGSVLVFENVLRGLTGGSSQIAIVLSTLIIAALFGPLRARVQRLIDQRFYRRKYDAARTLAAFGARVRDDVDLEALGTRLTTVVNETMQPAQVGLWVRAPEHPPKQP